MFNRNTQSFAFSDSNKRAYKNKRFCHRCSIIYCKLICPITHRKSGERISEVNTNIDRSYRHAKYPSVQWTCKKSAAYANHMCLGQTKFPSWAQKNSITHWVPFPPGTMGMAKQKEQPCLKFFYTGITSKTFYLVYLECSRGNVFDCGQTS